MQMHGGLVCTSSVGIFCNAHCGTKRKDMSRICIWHGNTERHPMQNLHVHPAPIHETTQEKGQKRKELSLLLVHWWRMIVAVLQTMASPQRCTRKVSDHSTCCVLFDDEVLGVGFPPHSHPPLKQQKGTDATFVASILLNGGAGRRAEKIGTRVSTSKETSSIPVIRWQI